MKKIDLAQSITILANLGVIAGIVFLGIELHQNNELLSAQVRRDQLDARTQIPQPILTNPELARIAYKASVGEELSPEEDFVYRSFVFNQIDQMRWQYEEYAAGNLDNLAVGGWRAVSSWPRWREIFRSTVGQDGSDFSRFMEENVIAE